MKKSKGIRKKGSLDMSINAIVIIVLAMTLLGLGLGFIRNQFTSISGTTGSVQEQVKEQVLETLRTGDKKLAFPATEINIERKKSQVLAIGVKNVDNTAMTFGIQFTPISGPTTEGVDGWFLYNKEPSAFTLAVADSNVYPIKVTVGSTTGTYLFKVKILTEGGNQYAEKDFFINVV